MAVYQAQMAHVLEEEIPDQAVVFIDDGGIMGPKEEYGGEKVDGNKGVRRFI